MTPHFSGDSCTDRRIARFLVVAAVTLTGLSWLVWLVQAAAVA